jgi:acyl carrier protein phosphodiesterase
VAAPYLEILESLVDGRWPIFRHRLVEGIQSPANRARALQLGDALWEKKWLADVTQAATIAKLRQEVDGLRSDMELVTGQLENTERQLSELSKRDKP